jgi:hypothetical protein
MKTQRTLAPHRHPQIAHLSEADINQMIDDYYDGRNTRQILDEHKVNFYPSGIIRLFPPVIAEEKECIYCRVKLWKDLEPKSRVFKNELYCPNCGHLDSQSCNCPKCRELKVKTLDNGKIIDDFNEVSNDLPMEVIGLTVLERVYLGTLLRTGLSEDKKTLTIQNFPESPVAPSATLLIEMISKLTERKLIVPKNDALAKNCDNFIYSKLETEINKLAFNVNVKNFESNEVIEYLLMSRIVSDVYNEELITIWKTIAVEECKSYLHYSLNYVDFPYNIGDKADVIFRSFLNHFSTSQIFGLISRCLGYAAKEFQAGKLSRISAGPYMVGALQNQADRALNNSWNLTKYFRPRELPESQLSKFFFNRILDIGDSGFSRLIHIENLRQ